MKVKDTQPWQAYWRTRSDADRNALVLQYAGLVVKTAKALAKRLPRCADLDDLKSAGNMGLIDAIPRFDPARAEPTTFLRQRIRGAMLDYLREIDHVPRLARGRQNKYERAVAALEIRFNRQPTDDEIRDHLKLTPQDYAKVKRDATTIPAYHSLGTEVYKSFSIHGRNQTVGDTLTDDRSPDPAAIAERNDLIREILATTRPAVSFLLVHYYMTDQSMVDIGRQLGVTESSISQKMKNARAIVRERMGEAA
jgi:RNA polymerase sigma factor FliA